MPAASDEVDLPVFPVRLTHAYMHTCTVSRETVEDPTSRQATVTGSIRRLSRDPGGETFNVVLGVMVTAPFREAAVLHVDCAVTGHFASAERMEEDAVVAFANREAVAILWPYLRAYVGQLGQMTQINLVPLPTLDVAGLLKLVFKPEAPVLEVPTPQALGLAGRRVHRRQGARATKSDTTPAK